MTTTTDRKETEIGMIPQEWEVLKLGDLGKTVTGKTPPTADNKNYDGDIPFIKIPDLGKSVYVNRTTTTISEKGLATVKNCLLPKDSIVVSCIATIGSIGMTSKPSVTNQQINSIIPNDKIVLPKFLYYRLNNFKDILGQHGGGGAVFDIISKSKFEQIHVSMPPLPEQEAIATTLGSLDDKIELLREQNKTLEAMGQAMFKGWFVDFEGQEFMIESEIGMIPKGWKIGKLGDIIDHVKETIIPSKNSEVLFSHYSIPAFDNGKKPMFEKGKTILSNKYSVKSMSFLVSKLNPSTPRIWTIIDPEINPICSTEFQVFIPKKINHFSFCHCIFNSQNFTEEISQKAHGTSGSHQRVKPQDILDLEILIPKEEECDKFEDQVSPLLKQISNNFFQIESLIQIRDILLPRLMSGKIRIFNS